MNVCKWKILFILIYLNYDKLRNDIRYFNEMLFVIVDSFFVVLYLLLI